MALDGLTISNLVNELNNKILDSRIYKIYQPEVDEIVMIIKNSNGNHRLLLSASASLPLAYISSENKSNPLNAPNFCMLLRKHIGNGRIVKIYQPNFERIIILEIEHLNELGDLCLKKLIIELMGKHSNIIFCNNENKIIDSIKHISTQISSVREVLPGKQYSFPPSQDKISPLEISKEYFFNNILKKPLNVSKAIYTSLTGISPIIAEELCYRSNIESSKSALLLEESEKEFLFLTISNFINNIIENKYNPCIIFKGKEPLEFSSIKLNIYYDLEIKEYNSISEVLQTYYSSKNMITRIKQKSVDLRRIVSTAIERTSKKYDLQLKQLKDTEKREKYKIYGELINTYGYNLKEGSKNLTAFNYYTNEDITIPLDCTISPSENAKKYFAKYNKLKRTFEALSTLTQETKAELDHLESISTSLDIALLENDLVQLKEELIEYGYIKRKGGKNKKEKITSKPFHYISSDGFDIYVGKNNYQNEELTFKFANGGDWWFHAKGVSGSHVIVKKGMATELPDKTFEEAGKLAGYYSKNRNAPKVEIDYTERKNIKKPAGAKPGFVIYHTNYSLIIEPNIDEIKQIN